MKPPCIGCALESADKNSKACVECPDRIAYANGIESTEFVMKHARKVTAHMEEPAQEEPKKICKGECGRLLPLSAYANHPGAKDKHEPACKQCRKERARLRYHANKQAKTTQITIHREPDPPQPARGPKELADKTDWGIFPFAEAEHVCKVFEYGAKKYGAPFTYRAGIPTIELLSAIFRHAIKLQSGVEVDQESGCLHASHIAANALMILSGKR